MEVTINVYHHYPEGKDAHLAVLKGIAELKSMVRAIVGDEKRLAELAAQLDANTQALAKEVAAP